MACGIPVVGSRRDASGDVVRTAGGGVVVDPDDPADLAAGLAAALRRPRGIVPEGLAAFGPAAFRDGVRRSLIGAGP
jgi:glycosyltransferase involved in cell wall biosynthesis